MSQEILKEEERVAFGLRSLYKKYGYLPYKMSKFEEYDLYAQNKDFLRLAGVVTFNDTDGKLLALKPDITLSIVKNDTDSDVKRKVYYNENVYRVSSKTGRFKELMQVGVECIGDLDLYDVFEAVYLAAGSLALISEKFVLDLSHLGILMPVLQSVNCGEAFEKAAIRCLAEKNEHGLRTLAEEYGVSKADTARLVKLISAYGNPDTVLKTLESVCVCENAKKALAELCALWSLLKTTEYADRIRLDFSVINDGNYYDDVVFKGFIDGIGESVLAGGRYDKLLKKLDRKSGAIGFAVYLDLLEGFGEKPRLEDVDVLVLYNDKVCAETLAKTVRALIDEGYSVSAQKSAGGLRYKKLVDLTGGGVC